MRYEKSCGAIVFTKIDDTIKYVIIQQVEGFHGFPKGHMEEGETEIETARREILEETGLKPTLVEGFRVEEEHFMPKKNAMKQVVYFLAEYQDQKFKAQETELINIQLMTYQEAMNILEYDNAKKVLTEANNFLTK